MTVQAPGEARSPVSARPSGWPMLRTPKWMLAAALVLVAGLALAAIPHHPSTAERAADLRGMVHDLNTDIESCAVGIIIRRHLSCRPLASRLFTACCQNPAAARE